VRRVTLEQESAQSIDAQRDAFVGRLFQSSLNMFEILTVYLGDRLDLYKALAEQEWSTPTAIAARTGVAQRYAREWLEQQAAAAIIDVDDVAAAPEARRYRLPLAHQEPLLDINSLSYLAPLARLTGSLSSVLPLLLEAYRSGGGVPWSAYGQDGREGQADLNRPVYLNLLGKEWLPSLPEVHARLQSDPPARVADIGCGGGWASIGIAKAYPNVMVDGFDVDAPSIELARTNAEAQGVASRVTFRIHDAANHALAGRYDLVCAFEMIHDLSQPVEVLRNMHHLSADGGTVLVMDERVAETFTAPGDEVERFMYAASVLCCLPAGLSESPSSGTGTVMRPTTLRQYAREAGFEDVEILPIEHDFFRVYRLVK
jgi:2-polyprenyl-3-methyl-5-hydroxy-6-metoxy-1,4-benzoquinol methylase